MVQIYVKLHLAEGGHLAGGGVEGEVEDAGRVTGQLERPRQLLELAAATELHFPHLRQVRYDDDELGYH